MLSKSYASFTSYVSNGCVKNEKKSAEFYYMNMQTSKKEKIRYENNEINVLARMYSNPQISLRQTERESGISQKSVYYEFFDIINFTCIMFAFTSYYTVRILKIMLHSVSSYSISYSNSYLRNVNIYISYYYYDHKNTVYQEGPTSSSIFY